MWWKHLLFVAFVSSAFAERKSYRGYSLLSADLDNADQVRVLTELQEMHEPEVNFLTQPNTVRPTDILVPPRLKQEILKLFRTNSIKYTERVSDYETVVEEEMKSLITNAQLSRSTQRVRDYIEDYYLTFEGIEEFLNDMANQHSNVMSVESLGLTYEGRNLYMVKISKNDGKKRPIIIVESLTHAREWITGAVTLNLIAALTERSSWEAEDMLELFDWYIVPVHNPDGYVYTSNNRMWRKNRAPVSRFCTGVDLNRNWDFEHGKQGTSTNPCSDTFSNEALSQIETYLLAQKMTEIVVESNHKVYGFISLHSYGQMLLVPYGYSVMQPAPEVDKILRDVAIAAMEKLHSVHGTNFIVGTPLETLGYGASGGAYDYAFGKLGIPFSYTYELRDRGSYGFNLPENQILPSFEETFESLYSIARNISSYVPSMK